MIVDTPRSNAQSKAIEVVCVGNAMVDIMFTELPKLPKIGEEYCTRRYDLDLGGSAALTSVALAQLGCRTALAATVGADLLGRFVKESLESYGVDVNCLQVAKANPTILSVEFSFPSDRATVTCFPTYDDIIVLECVRDYVRHARHLHVAGLTSARGALLSFATSHGVTTSVDTSARDALSRSFVAEWGSYIDLLMPSENQASVGTGTLESVVKELGRLVRKFCIIKLGNKGAIASDGKSVTPAGALQAKAVDTTGAGDAFNAGFLYGFLHGMSLDGCLATGNAMGALRVQAVGGATGVPTLDRLREYMAASGSVFVP